VRSRVVEHIVILFKFGKTFLFFPSRNEKLGDNVFVERVVTVDVVREQCHRSRRRPPAQGRRAAFAAETSAVDHHGRPFGFASRHPSHHNAVAVPAIRQVPAGRVSVQHVHQLAVHE